MLKLRTARPTWPTPRTGRGSPRASPGGPHAVRDGQGGPPNNGIVLGQYQTRVLDMASAYATLADSGDVPRPRTSSRRSSTPRARCCSTPAPRTTPASAASRRRSPTTSPPPCNRSPAGPTGTTSPVAGRRRPRPAPTSSVTPGQPGRLDGRLHAIAVDRGVGRHRRRHQAVGERLGRTGLRLRHPSDIWKATMDGAPRRAPTSSPSRSPPRSVGTPEAGTAAPAPAAPAAATE